MSWITPTVASLLGIGQSIDDSVFFAGGGGGGSGSRLTTTNTQVPPGLGGSGGGAAGGDGFGTGRGSNGLAATGGGGGGGAGIGGSSFGAGGFGGSGVVVLRYVQPANTTCAPLASSYVDTSTTPATPYTVVEFQGAGECNWTVPSGVTRVDALLVGGGGGGGGSATLNRGSGGGGAGGFIADTFTVVPQNTYTLTVGQGGSAGTNPGGLRTDGGDTSAFSQTAVGGGGGGGGSSSGCHWAAGWFWWRRRIEYE